MVQLVTLSHTQSIEEVKVQIPGLVPVDSSLVFSKIYEAKLPKLHVTIAIYHLWRFLEPFRSEALPILRHTRTQMDTLKQIFLNYGSVNCGFATYSSSGFIDVLAVIRDMR